MIPLDVITKRQEIAILVAVMVVFGLAVVGVASLAQWVIAWFQAPV